MKKILICGATGFIGRNLAEYYAENNNYSVLAVFNNKKPFSNSRIQWIQADLKSEQQVRNLLSGVDILIQAAATTSGVADIVSKPHIHVTDNAVMNSIIFQLATELKVQHVIFFSCTIMLQSSNESQTEDELDLNKEINKNYFGAAWTKIYLEKMCQFYSEIGKTKFTVIRHSNVFGPYDKFDLKKSHVLGASISKVMTSVNKITLWGNGQESRDLLFISDLVSLVDLVLKKQFKIFEIYNCGSGSVIKISDLVQLIIQISGKKLQIEYDLNKPSIYTNILLNCDKAKVELGWTPLVSLREGIKRTISWWSQTYSQDKQ